jgi:DNA-binding HxlR family transcriptional regulator
MKAPEDALCQHFQQAADVIGKRWNALIVRALDQGPRRYSNLKVMVDGISDAVLSDRLKELEASGIVRRDVIPSSPIRIDYALTDRGADLAGVMRELAAWAERWSEEPVRA